MGTEDLIWAVAYRLIIESHRVSTAVLFIDQFLSSGTALQRKPNNK